MNTSIEKTVEFILYERERNGLSIAWIYDR